MNNDTSITSNRVLLENIENNIKEKLLSAGESFQCAIFRLFKYIWENEKRPGQWKITEIIQLFKGKGELNDLSNYRHIHLKDFIPKAFETGLVDRSKNKITTACS